MDKPRDGVLAKVARDRRSFVQAMLGAAGYGVPAVRSFFLASAIAPGLRANSSVTTTLAPTTTSNAWRPTRAILVSAPSGGSVLLPNHPSEGSGLLPKPQPVRAPKKP
jgi:hypothetical protein